MQGSDLDTDNDPIAEQLKALKWRFRFQEPFCLALKALANKYVFKLERLHFPVTWNMITIEIAKIACFLESFDLVQQCIDINSDAELGGFFRASV